MRNISAYDGEESNDYAAYGRLRGGRLKTVPPVEQNINIQQQLGDSQPPATAFSSLGSDLPAVLSSSRL
ncbi:hypothetical protein NHX12_020135 [Muraenolepis orangiensis]|uniref:Uncharacterized protein n=1 Tax=Muraenolepis orangiensis TaxID=630683 RepID=A0A9Q0EZP4_9TELE|nr:hypothetical protein NHX12_020135 [Muraenolepis orangiensis]